MATEKSNATYSQFACIGTGFSGIGLGATLKRWYNITDVVLFERESKLGGTWHINQYPGCACDVPSPLYSFSFAPNGDWKQLFNAQADIFDYLTKVAEEYDLLSKMRFNATVERCEWNEARARWRMEIRDETTGTVSYHECKFLFSGVGQLIQPRVPNFPGMDTFKGDMFHAARWKHDVSLKDKNVIVVGNGCTADQIVPAIVKETKSLTQIVRSKHWIVKPPLMPNPRLMTFLFRRVPGMLNFIRLTIWLALENSWRAFYLTKTAARLRKSSEATARAYMKELAPAKYHDMLIPDFPIGCKRRIFNPGYLECLHEDNLTLTDKAILEVVPEGVRTQDGIIEADVIALATGYTTNSFLPRIELVGRNGETAEEHWEKTNGAAAYNATLLSGFPNFFMILGNAGPNTVTGHTSTVFAIENSINYALRILKPVLDGETVSVDCLQEAEDRWDQTIQEGLTKTVWADGICNNWYSRNAKGEQARNSSTYPFMQGHFWYKCFFPPTLDRRTKRVGRYIKIAVLAFALFASVKAARAVREEGFKNIFQGYAIQAFLKFHMLRMRVQQAIRAK
ncbi:dimethylaniline monooxygenase, putative [Cordyceps militaris CM01]|uniref:Dimethylaniline monooxygenase, putative n=1 Tax=Cordyceps militaris (strain CM01) TaxID=983644 RepID=G3J625_CORMM|nr:dimethylaniline monooxygenase, putative [Cordyceps militaris CM01]EGX96129.1 dimethylaniline monooxygenase, putative [Cordyceps militaris CM01]